MPTKIEEAQELAAWICGLPPEDDAGSLDDSLTDRWGIDFDTFEEIANELLGFVMPVPSGLIEGETVRAFAVPHPGKPGVWQGLMRAVDPPPTPPEPTGPRAEAPSAGGGETPQHSREKRYHIRALAPAGAAPRMEAIGIQVIVKGEMTPGEYLETFGDDNINHAMCLETYDRNEYTINVYAEDVLACENQESHQAALINAMLRQAGMPELEKEETVRRARDHDTISHDALQFLLELAENGLTPEEVRMEPHTERARLAGFTLQDFLEPETITTGQLPRQNHQRTGTAPSVES